MQGEQIEEKSLQMLIGEQLSAVTFVQDYLHLYFDGPRLTVFFLPCYRAWGPDFSLGQARFS
jgi:hypothetical protein